MSAIVRPRVAERDSSLLRAARREYVDGKRHGAALTGIERADTDYLPRDFLASIVADRDHDRVFPRVGARWIAKRAFDPQCGESRLGPTISACIAVEPQMMVAARADARAFQDGCLAMRAGPGFAGRRDSAVHGLVNAWASRPNRIPLCHACVNPPPR